MSAQFDARGEWLSVWKSQDDHETQLIIAAIRLELVQNGGYTHSLSQTLQPLSLLPVDEADLSAAGQIVHTPQNAHTPVLTARALHYDLPWPQQDLDAFSLWLAKIRQPSACTYRKNDIHAALKMLRANDLATQGAIDWCRKEVKMP